MERKTEASLNDSIKPVSIKDTELILQQMKKCVCKIHLGPKKGTGFFIKIPYKNQLLNALMTNNHVLGENEIQDGNSITISMNNEEIIKNIKIDSKRKRYTNEILDITIIELLERDNIINYLSLDKQILDIINFGKDDNSVNYYNNLYKKGSIYILNYISNNSADEIFISYGLLDNINKNEIYHRCSTGNGSSGSPILLLKTKKVIGIHFGGNTLYNLGLFLMKPLIEFQNISNNLHIIRKKEGKSNLNTIAEYGNNSFHTKADKIYNFLKYYYLNEKDIISKLGNQINQSYIYQGFLVDKNWVDKYRKYLNYDYIKNNYLDKNIFDETKIKKKIIDYLIINNYNYDELNNVDNFILKDINQLKLPQNLNKSFVLLNFNFLSSFLLQTNMIPTTFYLSYKKVQIKLHNQSIISFQTNNNIIINKSNDEYDSYYLKHLLKFIFLKKELLSPINISNKKLFKAYIINSQIINKFIQIP